MKSMIKSNNGPSRVIDVIDKVIYYLSLVLFVLCLIFALICFFTETPSPVKGYDEYTLLNLAERIGAIALILLPPIVKKLGMDIPKEATIGYNAFIVITVFFGTFAGMYINTNWWDKFNHTLSGALLGLCGLFFLNPLTRDSKKLNPFCVFVFVFAFAIMCGGVWEIYEYTCDGLFGTNMQKFRNDHSLVNYIGRAALDDTMRDVIVDAAGALLAGIGCAIAAAKNRDFIRAFSVSFRSRGKTADAPVATELNREVAATTEPQECEATAQNETKEE